MRRKHLPQKSNSTPEYRRGCIVQVSEAFVRIPFTVIIKLLFTFSFDIEPFQRTGRTIRMAFLASSLSFQMKTHIYDDIWHHYWESLFILIIVKSSRINSYLNYPSLPLKKEKQQQSYVK